MEDELIEFDDVEDEDQVEDESGDELSSLAVFTTGAVTGAVGWALTTKFRNKIRDKYEMTVLDRAAAIERRIKALPEDDE